MNNDEYLAQAVFDIEGYIQKLQYSPETPDITKTIVAGNLRTLYQELLPIIERQFEIRADAEKKLRDFRIAINSAIAASDTSTFGMNPTDIRRKG